MRRQKNLSLKRAYFNEGFNGNLEDIVRASFSSLETPRDRVVPIDLIASRVFMSYENCAEGGTALRVFDFEVGATGAINLDTTDVTTAIEAFEHPESKDFLKEQLVVLIDKNHLFCCGVGNKGGTLAAGLLELAERADVLSGDVRMQIADVPNQVELERVNRIGVKQVEFSLANYFESLRFAETQNAGTRIIKMIFGQSVSTADSIRRAAMLGKIVLQRNKFRADEMQKDRWLTEIGEEVLKAGSAEKFLLVLEDNSRIKPEEMQRTKPVNLSRLANTYAYSNAVQELAQFRTECVQDGTVGV